MKEYRVRETMHQELLPHLMLSRGIGEGEFDAFLRPNFERDSHDPFLLPGMGTAVDRLLAAKANNEKVAVWSDYDCDGIPGGVLLTEYFRAMGLEVTHYIPHRHKEGYGLNNEGLAELAAQGITLVVTVDLGTTEVTQVAFAKTKGIDVIITDHHLEPPVLPDAVAIINPKLSSSKYPFDGLCGAGVAWKLAQALQMRGNYMKDGQEKWLIDLAGLGTLSDMVPLVGENRMIAHYGLVVMRRGRRAGLAALLKLLRINRTFLTEDDVGFMVAPRINAASRMDNPVVAANLLRASGEEATALARTLNKINDERKGLVASTVKEVNKRLALGTPSPVIVMGNPGWRPGILGLVANSLVEAHGKPVFLWGREGGETIRGSVRGNGVNVVELMRSAADAFDEYGGHAASGGFSVSEAKVHELPMRLAAAYETLASTRVPKEEVFVDRALELAEVAHTQRGLMQLAPFGVGNQKPLFMFPGVSVTGMRMFGKQQNHMEFTLDKGTRTSGIAFFSTPESFTKQVAAGDKADIVGHVELDWKGAPRVRVVDII